MHQIPFKALLWPVVITLALLFGTGIFAIKKPEYSCFKGKSIHFDDKITVVSVGNFRVNAYPLVHDCDPEDRYDPTKIQPCGYQTFCNI